MPRCGQELIGTSPVPDQLLEHTAVMTDIDTSRRMFVTNAGVATLAADAAIPALAREEPKRAGAPTVSGVAACPNATVSLNTGHSARHER